MILFILTQQMPPILLLTLAGMAYLTGYELNKEKDLPFMIKAWWVLLVLLFNIVGFGIFWLWLAARRRRSHA